MALERKATNGRNLGTYESSERNRSSRTKVDLIHAHPGVALGAVGHDAIVAGKGDHCAVPSAHCPIVSLEELNIQETESGHPPGSQAGSRIALG